MLRLTHVSDLYQTSKKSPQSVGTGVWASVPWEQEHMACRRPKIIDVSLFTDGPKRMESLYSFSMWQLTPKKHNA